MKKSLFKNRVMHYCILTMKYSIIVSCMTFCFCSLAIANESYSQKILNNTVQIELKDVTLDAALQALSAKANIKFAYQDKMVRTSLQVNQNFSEVKLSQVLRKILTPYQLTYYMVDDVVVIIKQANQDVIKGKVTDSSGTSMSGVSISIKGGSGTYSDQNGNFSIKADADAILVFSYMGFIRQEVSIGKNSFINVKLIAEVSDLNEVIVVGYGTVKKSDLTGSVDKVNMKDALKAPVRSFAEFLAGRVAGVQVSSTDGQPGAGVNIVIRGNNSITQDNSPLYVIDGFPNENLDPNVINPEDIESIEVLKDASATAIYGARGSNGVIIITTKKGQEGPPIISFKTSYGIQNRLKNLDLMNPSDFVNYQLERDTNPTDTLSPTALYLGEGRTLDFYKTAPEINWQDLILRQAPIQNNSLSISGGNAKTRYSVSGSLINQDGIIINSDYKRYQGRVTLDQTVNAKLKVGINVNYSNLGQTGISPSQSGGNAATTLLYSVYGSRPVTGVRDITGIEDDLFDPTVNLSTEYRINPVINQQNLVRKYSSRNLTANAYAQYAILPELVLRVTGGIFNTAGQYESFSNSKTLYGSRRTTWGASYGVNGSINNSENNSWINENTLTWNKKINDHSINILGGVTEQAGNTSAYAFAASNLPNETLGIRGLNEGLPIPLGTVATASLWRMSSFLGRANYNYKSKYYVTTSFRADGSSKFSPENRWGYFPSAAVSWRLIEEGFMKNIRAVSDAKIRLSYGLTGNNRVSDFAYLSTAGLPIYNTYIFNNVYNSSLVPLTTGNKDLKWETTSQFNAGLDLGFLKDRINLTADIYRKKTYDLLLNASLPFSMGYTNAFKNIGSMSNEGLELSLNAVPVQTKNFSWTSNINIAFNKSKILSLTEGQEYLTSAINWDNNWSTLPAYISKVGMSVGNMYGFIWDGVYQYDDFDKNTTSGAYVLKDGITTNGNTRSLIKPGDIKYKDLNGDGTVNASDYTAIGRGLPIHTGGFNNSFTYKQFDLNLFFQWSYGNDAMNVNRLVFEGNVFNKPYLNQLTSYNNRWTPENTNTDLYRTGGFFGGGYSSRTVEDASYLRLKTVAFGYNLPAKLSTKLGIRTFRIYTSAQNVITWTKYSGVDPEVSNYNSVLTPGFDFSSYPQARTIVIGANLTF
ncbi:TonB-linked SusC/RagA family outer membrane protein [Pedobacter sp. CG_S7]|uniref:TonB-dependent receptor n=1 Tax=Pedobacter sp. CG_S7 TaxID=3143930 RepID=UPI0033983B9B